jgi:hypothetical protein
MVIRRDKQEKIGKAKKEIKRRSQKQIYTSNEKTVSNDKSFSSLDLLHKVDLNEKCKIVKGHVLLYLSF